MHNFPSYTFEEKKSQIVEKRVSHPRKINDVCKDGSERKKSFDVHDFIVPNSSKRIWYDSHMLNSISMIIINSLEKHWDFSEI